MNEISPNDKDYLLFEAVRLFVLDSGGDGDGWIVSGRYRELADKFEAHEKQHEKKWFLNRQDGEGEVCFYEQQESINFVTDMGKLPKWAGDIIVQVW